MFHNVLLGIDGSASAAQALDRAVAIARGSRGRIGLLSVVPELSPWVALAPLALPVSRARLCAELETEALRRVDEAERAVPADVPVTKLVARGRAVDALLTHALDGPWDLIVVGDRQPLRRLRKSPIPVLVVRPGCEELRAPAASRKVSRAQLPPRARLHTR